MNKCLSAKVYCLGHFISKIPFASAFIRRYHLWGVQHLSKLLPFAVSSIYLKGGLLKSNWNFTISDVDLVIVLPHQSLDLLEEQKRIIKNYLPLLRLLCPNLHDCDLVLQKYFHLACEQKAYYRRDVDQWKKVFGLELRAVQHLSPLSLSFYEHLEILYFYMLWFSRKRQMIISTASPRENVAIKHLFDKWRAHFDLPPIDYSSIDQAFKTLVELSESYIYKQMQNHEIEEFVEQLVQVAQPIACHSTFASFYTDFDAFLRAPNDSVLPVWTGERLYLWLSQFGIIRLWDLYQLCQNSPLLLPQNVKNQLKKKLLWRSIEWWDDWGRENYGDQIVE